MAGYLVLARKYRSETFEEVVGQEHIAQTLVNAINSERVHHAYLFTGTRGVGKTTMARILAKALNCMKADDPTPTPCGKCDACVSIARGDDVDVVEIDGASNRGIDDIRDLRANAIFKPSRCRYKVYYIDEVHQVTKDAFNALLKTLEEPPDHVKFIFATTEPEKIPATILSRCQRFDFRNIPTARIVEHLAGICKAEGVDADGDALFRIARAAAGSMRDALSLLDQLLAGGTKVSEDEVVRVLGTPGDEVTIAIARAIATGSSAEALTQLDGILASGVTLDSVANALGDAFRNMMLAATCGPDSDLIELPEQQRKDIGELAGRFTLPSLVHAVGVLQTTARNIRGSSVSRALLEAALVRLAEADKFVDAASLVERLERAEAAGGPATGQKKKPVADIAAAPRPTHGRQDLSPSGGDGESSSQRGALADTRPHRFADSAPAPKGEGLSPAPPPAAPKSPPSPVLRLSSDETQEVREDPAVQSVLSLFDGNLSHIDPDKTVESSRTIHGASPSDAEVAEEYDDE
jgi:DNA polymerase-3 subunit gamma/tau